MEEFLFSGNGEWQHSLSEDTVSERFPWTSYTQNFFVADDFPGSSSAAFVKNYSPVC